MSQRARLVAEWPTLGVVLLCYLVWAIGTTWLAGLWLPLGIAVTALGIALFSSLQHEIIHDHPFANRTLNAALVFPGLSVLIPFLRFRDTHLDHHRNADLTDPYDDPESNYLDPAVWRRLPRPVRGLLLFNNTLLGRLTVGVAVSQVAFMVSDWRAMRGGDDRVRRGWLWHVPALALVVVWFATLGQMPFWAYLLAAYGGLSIVKIRTFLEHQAHARVSGRTAIIEDRGPLAFLFLNNNLHAVHHMHPRVPWYRLPRLYFANRDRYLARNGGYVFRSYAQVFRGHFLRRKDPVPHPFWR
ncbi:MAG: fatty acid desaturase [Rhodobacter sp.]|nr:fatty acid desaturase [Rhodobacter sp.]